MNSTFGVILPHRLDANGAVTVSVDQKQVPVAVQASVMGSLLADTSIHELARVFANNCFGTLAAEFRSQDYLYDMG